jgi:integrase/recombinase XerD
VPAGLAIRGRAGKPSAHQAPLLCVPNSAPQIVNPEEINRFLASLRTYRDQAMVLLMVLGGLRKSEVVGLALADVQVGKKQVTVRHGKGDRLRTCCVAPSFFQVLNRYLQEERPPTESDALFVCLKGPRRGQPLSVHGLTTIVEYHRAQADTPHIQCHRLRHTCLTALREAGMSLEALQAQAGHQDINSTRVYLHLSNALVYAEYLQVSKKMFTEPTGSQPTTDEPKPSSEEANE